VAAKPITFPLSTEAVGVGAIVTVVMAPGVELLLPPPPQPADTRAAAKNNHKRR
jgi:hypothetical protein